MTSPTGAGAIGGAVDRAVIIDRLSARFPELGGDEVAAAVDRAAGRLADARVDGYLPILVERLARRDLLAVRPPAAASGPDSLPGDPGNEDAAREALGREPVA